MSSESASTDSVAHPDLFGYVGGAPWFRRGTHRGPAGESLPERFEANPLRNRVVGYTGR